MKIIQKYYLRLITVGFISLFTIEINAQFRVMVSPSLEKPMVFANDPGYNSTFGFKLGGFYEASRLSIGLSVGYHSFSSSEGILNKKGLNSFQLDSDPTESSSIYSSSYGARSCDTCTYTEEFGDLTVIPIMIEWNQYLLKSRKVKISTGLNVGIRIYSYSHVITFDEQLAEFGYDPYAYPLTEPKLIVGTITTDKTDTRLSLSPKIAFEYLISSRFSVYFEPAFNLQTPSINNLLGPNDPFDLFFSETSVLPNSYKVDQMFSMSLGFGFIYNFGRSALITE